MHDQCATEMPGMPMQDHKQAEDGDERNNGADPDLQNDHVNTPARKATQMNQTQAAEMPLPAAHRLPLMM